MFEGFSYIVDSVLKDACDGNYNRIKTLERWNNYFDQQIKTNIFFVYFIV